MLDQAHAKRAAAAAPSNPSRSTQHAVLCALMAAASSHLSPVKAPARSNQGKGHSQHARNPGCVAKELARRRWTSDGQQGVARYSPLPGWLRAAAGDGRPGWSCTKGGGASRPRCSRDRCSATAGRLDEWSGGSCSSRVPLQEPPTSSVWFAFPWDLTILSTPAGPGSTNPSHHLAAPAAPRLGMPAWQLVEFPSFPLKIIHICKFRL